MAVALRQRRLTRRTVLEDRAQMLEFTLGQLDKTQRMSLPEGQQLADVNLADVDVQAVLEHSEGGEVVDLSSGQFVFSAQTFDSTDAEERSLKFKLDGDKLSLAAFEALLLHVQASDTEYPDGFCNEIRLGLSLPKRQAAIVIKNIDVQSAALPKHEDPRFSMQNQEIIPTSLHYRFQMLAARRPSDFDNDQAFETWQERQIGVFLHGLQSEFAASHFIERDTISSFGTVVEAMFQELLDFSRPGRAGGRESEGRISTRRSEGFPEKDYRECLLKINRFLCHSLYPKFVSGPRLHSDSSETQQICIRHGWPLNTRLYSRLLQTCFDAEEKGVMTENGRETLGALDGMRSFLGLSEQMHLLTYAQVLCEELQESSSTGLVGELKDQILDLTSQGFEDSNHFNPFEQSQESDKALVLREVARDGLALEFVSAVLKADRDVVLAAVSQNGNAAQHALELQGDEEVRIAAVAQRVARHRESQHRLEVLQKLRGHFRETLMNYHSFHSDVPRIEEYLDVYLKTGIGYTIDRSLITLGAALASPVAETVGEERYTRDEVVLRAGLAEAASGGLRAGESATVVAVHENGTVDLRRQSDGRVMSAVPLGDLASTQDPMTFGFSFVSDMIREATVKSYNAMTGYRPRPLAVRDLAEIVGECLQQLERQADCFSPLLKQLPHHESPDIEYLRELGTLISKDHADLREPEGIDDDDFKQCLQLMEEYDDYVHAWAEGEQLDERKITPLLTHAEIKSAADKCRAPISGMLWDWVQMQQANFDTFTDGMLALETWEPVCEGVLHSSSIVDMFSMFRRTMDFFFSLELGVPDFLVHLLESVVAANMKYANLMKTHKTYSDEISITDLQEDLISPTPPLCRPVRIADASMLRDQCPKMSVPTIPDICVRMCNLYNARKQFKTLANDVLESFLDLMEYRRKEIPEDQSRLVSSYNKSINRTYKDAIFELQEFLGYFCVYYELRQSYLEHTYAPTPQDESAGILRSLKDIEELIVDIKEMAEPELVEDIVHGIKRAMLIGYKRILLNGGTHRIFTAVDSEVCIRDLALLVGFFGQEPTRPMSVADIPEYDSHRTMSCGRCGLREANLFFRKQADDGEEQRCWRFSHEAHCSFWYHNILLDSISETQQQPMILHCQKCEEETAAAGGGGGNAPSAGGGPRRGEHKVSAAVQQILDILVVMKQPSAHLVGLANDPEAARRKDGGAFSPTVLAHVLAHRLDDEAVAHGQLTVPSYDSGGERASTHARDQLVHGNELVRAGTRAMGAGLKNFAQTASSTAKAAAASVSDISMSMTTREAGEALEALDEVIAASPAPENPDETSNGQRFKKLWGRLR